MNAINLNKDRKNQIKNDHEKDQRDRTIFKRKKSYVTKTKPYE